MRKSHCVLVIKRDAGGLVRDHRPGGMSEVLSNNSRYKVMS